MLGCNGLTDMASQTTQQKKKTGTDGDKWGICLEHSRFLS